MSKEEWKPILKAQDMSEEMQATVMDVAQRALANTIVEREVAVFIKKELDETYGHSWHVVVGKNFGSHVTHEVGHFIYFYIGPYAFMIFKSG